jgi:hypothetical protein
MNQPYRYNKLITALRLTANAIKINPDRYYWREPESCNVGLLICALMGWSPSTLRSYITPTLIRLAGSDRTPFWSTIIGYQCPMFDFGDGIIFKTMTEVGLRKSDIFNLEWLVDPNVLDRMPTRTEKKFSFWRMRMVERVREVGIDDPIDCANYMLAWADILVEENNIQADKAELVTS